MPLLEAKFPILTADANTLARDLSVVIGLNTIVGMMGPNGCGKSLLLDCICGLVKMPNSTIYLSSTNIKQLCAYKRWKQGIRRLFQYPSLPVKATIESVFDHFGGSKNQKINKIYSELLNGYQGKTVEELSYGQRRLLEVVAITKAGSVFLLDEPFAGVSTTAIPKVVEIIKQLRSIGGVLLVDHSFDRLNSIADCIISWPTMITEKMIDYKRLHLGFHEEINRYFNVPRISKDIIYKWTIDYIIAGESRFVNGLDVEVGPGEILYVLGPNGSGKSTVLRSIAGLPQPVGIICGNSISNITPNNVHYSSQPPKLISTISVLDNLLLMLSKKQLNSCDYRYELNMFVKMIGLDEKLLRKKAQGLSGGESAIISLIGAVISDKKLLLLDEPFEGLSKSGQMIATELINAALSSGKSVIATAHSVLLNNINGYKIYL